MRIFRYLPEVDAFDVTPEYRQLAESLGLIEWNPVVWIGRLFTLDNDYGEHWFDNWDAREERRAAAERLGLDPRQLLVIDPSRFSNKSDGPCHTDEFRARFWHDVLVSLDLSPDVLFEEARKFNRAREITPRANPIEVDDEYIPDLEARIAGWRRMLAAE